MNNAKGVVLNANANFVFVDIVVFFFICCTVDTFSHKQLSTILRYEKLTQNQRGETFVGSYGK